MLSHRKKRLSGLLSIVAGISIAAGLALYALRHNVNLYLTPQQVTQRHLTTGQIFRLGGMVVNGSVQHGPDLQTKFSLTDYHNQIQVEYRGVLPSLFHEGQGIVAQGRLNEQGVFIATEVLAKHDANYKPPAISKQESTFKGQLAITLPTTSTPHDLFAGSRKTNPSVGSREQAGVVVNFFNQYTTRARRPALTTCSRDHLRDPMEIAENLDPAHKARDDVGRTSGGTAISARL